MCFIKLSPLRSLHGKKDPDHVFGNILSFVSRVIFIETIINDLFNFDSGDI